MNTMSMSEAAYVAGLLDGEGCFSIFKKGNGMLGLSLSVYMTHEETLQTVKRFTGTAGKVLPIPGRENRQDQWLWKPTLAEAKIIVEQILPYLVTKKRNAELFLEILEVRKHSSRWDNKMDQQVAIMQENSRLNKRGKD